MVTVLGEGINPILSKLKYPDLSVKVRIDEGENVVVQYEYDQSSPIDILGYGMNLAAKITSITEANGREFHELITSRNDWKYVNVQTGKPYKAYTSN
jgi:adenylate cyclase